MSRYINRILAAVLAAGLLLGGIGFGIFAGDLSTFSYGGSAVASSAQERHFSQEFFLPDSVNSVELSLWLPVSRSDPENLYEVVSSSEMAPGTFLLEADYRAIPSMELNACSYFLNEDKSSVSLSLESRSGSTLAAFLSLKDHLLEDLKQRQLRDITLLDVSKVRVTLNPADEGRLLLPNRLEGVLSEDCISLE